MARTNKAEVNEQAIEQVEQKHDLAALMEKFKTKSAVIRHLDSEKMTRGDIAKLMGIRYQHVRNVLVQPVKTTSAS